MLYDLWARRAELTPHRPAVWSAGRWHTYADLDRRARSVAGQLAARGVRKGERIALVAFNDFAYLDLLGAARKTGAVFVPFNFHWSAAETQAAARYVRPRVLVFGPEQAALAEAVRSAQPDVGLLPIARAQAVPTRPRRI